MIKIPLGDAKSSESQPVRRIHNAGHKERRVASARQLNPWKDQQRRERERMHKGDSHIHT